MPILGTSAGSIPTLTNGGYTMTYYTQEQLLTLIINDVVTWMNDELTPYTPTYPEIIPYAGQTLQPYWLEAKCIEELGLLTLHLGEPTVPNFVTNYSAMLSVQVYTELANYYNGI